jgi:DNA polymerase III delta prime subunit
MATVGARGVMGIESSGGTHPFFQNRPIPHRVIKVPQNDDNIEMLLQSTKSEQSKSRKRKSGPLIEKAYNSHLPPPAADDSSIDTNSARLLVVQSAMDKTPKRKVLKLNSNGKLLSSPPPSPVPVDLKGAKEVGKTSPLVLGKRTKTRSPRFRSSSLIAKIGYGQHDSDERLRVGSNINEVLGSPWNTKPSGNLLTPKKKRAPKTPIHPFFSGTARPASSSTDDKDFSKGDAADLSSSGAAVESALKRKKSPAKPPRKDISVSSTRRPAQHRGQSPAPWPSIDIQRVDDLPDSHSFRLPFRSLPLQTYKLKGRATPQLTVTEEEDILHRASYAYSESILKESLWAARHPARNILSGEEMSSRLEDRLLLERLHLATQSLRSYLTTTPTAFDQGKCEQSSWITKSSPSRATEVLQPGPEAVLLRDWVKKLTVTSVEGGQSEDKLKCSKAKARKGRPRKRSGEVDDFIICSEDEADELREIDQSTRETSPFIDDVKGSVLRTGVTSSSQDRSQTKNTILISGPTGCGKTASVYAVAKELNFEVFEIHSGIRRGAKEILEKVGDMTQNHLVRQQSGENSAEETPSTSIDDNLVKNEIAAGKQRTMNGFFLSQARTITKAGRKRKALKQDDEKEEVSTKKLKKAQKQSLILLEEVDVLFEDDKSFWSGVLTLINQSKRPIILTCNDEAALPLEELPLHGILRYSQPPEDLATDHLLTMAASEGHELDRDAVSYLYRSRKHDLRATIMELDFWCQMGIGSRKGGLDWMLDRTHSAAEMGNDTARLRVFSTDTYLRGMGLTLQQPEMDPEQLVFDAYQQLQIPIDTWCAEADRTFGDSMTMREASLWTDTYSDLDLCQPVPSDIDPSDFQLRIAVSLATRLSPKSPTSNDIIDAHIKTPQPPKLTRSTFSQIFEPLANEKPTFPPSLGRLAPSLDSPMSTITTDIAPYIRSIVAFEQKWGASLPVPKKNTRSSAKPEGHFPKKTNPKHVLMTGGDGWQDLWAKPVQVQGDCMDEDMDSE